MSSCGCSWSRMWLIRWRGDHPARDPGWGLQSPFSLESGRFCGLGSSSGPPKTVMIHRLCMPLVLWTALPSQSIDHTSDLETELLDSWTPPPSGSTDSHNPRCSSHIVIVLLLCSVHVTSIARLSQPS